MIYYFTGINISLCELMIISNCPWVKEEKQRLEMEFPTAPTLPVLLLFCNQSLRSP